MADPIVIERLLDTSPEETFALLTEPERLRRWQAISAAVDLRVGGDYRLTVSPGNVASGTVLELDPGRRVVFSWGWVGSDDVPPGSSTLLVELEPEGEQTRVRFTHSGLDEIWAARHNQGWQHYGDRLVAAVGEANEIDPWNLVPEEPDHLNIAEATWAICRHFLAFLTAEHKDRPTPCADFTTHQLVEHLRGSMVNIGAMAGATVDETIESTTAEDFVAVAVEAALAAWRHRGLDGEVPFGVRTAPATVPAGILSLEFLVHAWDIAQTLGMNLEVPEVIGAYVLDIARTTIRDDNRGPDNGFGPALDPVGDDPMAQLIAFTGRKMS